MNQCLKNYSIKITTLAPVYIGGGASLSKKEYVYDAGARTVYVLDLFKMSQGLSQKGLLTRYMTFMQKSYGDGLDSFFSQCNLKKTDYMPWVGYSLAAGDAFERINSSKKAGTLKGIDCFIKDPYQLPYIPGSSLKGFLRTALLVHEIMQENRSEYNRLRSALDSALRPQGKVSRTFYLSRETQQLEQFFFHTLKRNEKRHSDAVNCNLAGLIVSDSEPIPVDRLILSQKIDMNMKREEKPLPILREAIKPDTVIQTTVTLDSSVCPYTISDIQQAINEMNDIMYRLFYSKFGRGSQDRNIIWLGGGVGFPGKTLWGSMFGEEYVRKTDQVFRNTLGKNYFTHKHDKDLSLGVSPHTCKCTRFEGKTYDMGMAKFEVV